MNFSQFSETKETELVIVIVSNGPGELNTWVKPIAEKLKNSLPIKTSYDPSAPISLRLVLVPCPNATGNEEKVAAKWKIFGSISKAKDFWRLLFNPKKFNYWPSKGVVIFLGGDQFWSVLLARRLNYKNITYAEWVARWPFWNDRIAAMSEQVKELLPKKLQKRCVVVGDLMADIQKNAERENPLPKGKWIALLPGSKKAKLSVGVPFFLEVADHIQKMIPDANLLIPIAPTTSIEEIQYFNSPSNKISQQYSSNIKEIEEANDEILWKKIITIKNTQIHLIEENPAYKFLSQCDLAITTVGANTSELGSLCIPMIVVLPTQHLNVMEAWDGLIGIFGRFPLIKSCIGWLINYWRLRGHKYVAWPNIKANRMIVPERVGIISPIEIAKEANYWINSKERLKDLKEELKLLRGKSGAIQSIVAEIKLIISKL